MLCSASSEWEATQATGNIVGRGEASFTPYRGLTCLMRRWACLPVSELAPLLGVGQNVYCPCGVVDDWRAENTNCRLHTSILISTTNMRIRCPRRIWSVAEILQASGQLPRGTTAQHDHSMQRTARILAQRRKPWAGWADPQCYEAPCQQEGPLRAHIDVAAGRVHVLPGDRPVSDEILGPHSGARVCKRQRYLSGRCIRSILRPPASSLPP